MSSVVQDPHNPQNWFAGNSVQGYSQASFFGIGDQTNSATGALKTLLNNALGSPERSAMASRIVDYVHEYRQRNQLTSANILNNAWLAFRPNLVAETGSGQIPAPVAIGSVIPADSNSRFTIRLFRSYVEPHGHLINSGGQSVLTQQLPTNAVWDQDQIFWFATANHKSVIIFGYSNNTKYYFRWAGVLNSHLPFPTNCAILSINQTDFGYTALADRVLLANSTNRQSILTSGAANYSIVCDDATSVPTCEIQLTTFWLRDNSSGFPPAGSCDNLLLGKGQSWNIGEVILVRRRTPGCVTTTDPIEGSATRTFMACARFGTDTLFMRIANAFA